MKKIKAIRGMNDLLPQDSPKWQYLESQVRQVLASYNYQEIRMPVVEETSLFQRSIGEVTDIVEKEMYTFADRNDESLTLRPEGTAGCVRAAEEHGLLYNQQQRLWYQGPMFRYERPQKGRYRQFHQIGVETFGMQGPDIDAEVILLSARLWKKLGLLDNLTLELNTLGSNEARANYRDALTEFLQTKFDKLDADSQRRLATNPLRILDSKVPSTQAIVQDAPKFADYLDAESAEHFTQLQDLLTAAGVKFKLNPLLVRGLDYYNQSVFEWTTTALGAQGTVCAGGRYDGLVEQLGGKATPAVGFAMGIERLVLLLETLNLLPENLEAAPHVYLVLAGEGVTQAGLVLAEQLRDQLPELRLLTNCGGGNFRQQFRRADNHQAKIALVLGEDELAKQEVTVKFLQTEQGENKPENKPQEQVAFSQLASFLKATLF